MTLRIEYESEGFPAGGPVANGWGTLVTSWDQLLWSALTVGRPNRHYVFQHGDASLFEALFRLSLLRMTLEQVAPVASRLRRTAAARTLDPTEKGAVSYFLGLAICKLFASRLLAVPWLLHLDVFRPQLNVVLAGRSRPDLVGTRIGGEWIALECKGRLSAPAPAAKDRAKEQATRVVSVNGLTPAYHIGGIAFFRNEVLQFFWRDPESDARRVKAPIEVTVEPVHWGHHYRPCIELIRSRPNALERMLKEEVLIPIERADFQIGIHPTVLRQLVEPDGMVWNPRFSPANVREMGPPYQPDGIAVIAGPSWLVRFEEATDELA